MVKVTRFAGLMLIFLMSGLAVANFNSSIGLDELLAKINGE